MNAPQAFSNPPAARSEASQRLAVRLASEHLAPVMLRYLALLDAHLRYAARSGAQLLFVSRAGVRIERLYREYCAARGQEPPPGELLWTSRCLAAKAAWSRAPDEAAKAFVREFRRATLREACAALLRGSPQADSVAADPGPELAAPVANLAAFLHSAHPVAQAVTRHFEEQHALLADCLRRLLGNSRRAMLVDTGWAGTIQHLLARAYEERDWAGTYFGKIPAAWSNPPTMARATGLMFESERLDPERPHTAFALYRHLVEGVLEPHGPSIDRLEPDAGAGVHAAAAAQMSAEAPTAETDPMYLAVLEHVRQHAASNVAGLDQAGSAAMRRLGRVLAFPSREEALALGALKSSADFGRPLLVPVLIEPGDPEQAERHIRESLWPQGQIALEYEGRMARLRQQAQLGLTLAPEELFGAARVRMEPALPSLDAHQAAVAVIVRTVNRPQFLRRALLSIGRQTFEDYLCVVVCDGGDLGAVLEECRQAPLDPRRLVVVHHPKGLGMEAASNSGIRKAGSAFVAIHDDDDTWEPEFLRRTVGFLRNPEKRHYGGVVTWATQVSEVATPRGPVIKARKPFRMPNEAPAHGIHFMQMACANQYPPIAFLFRRAVYERIGGFDEALPVLGDWQFNLRFLLEADIGVIREALANYHLRDLERDPLSGNTITEARERHLAYDVVIRNAFLRSALDGGKPEGGLLVMAQLMADLRRLGSLTKGAVDQIAQRLPGEPES